MNDVRVSYHGGHSGDFCDHAKDTKKAIIEAYGRNGFSHAGIIEHMPWPNDDFLYDDEIALGHDAKFLAERFSRYFSHARNDLQNAFTGKIHLLFGFETEFCGPGHLAQLTRIIEEHAPDYVVASVHHVNGAPFDYSPGEYGKAVDKAGGIDALYETYYDHQLELISHLSSVGSEMPIVIGHFDLIKLFSPDHRPSRKVAGIISRNIRKAIKRGCIFEVNSRAFMKGLNEPYPGIDILTEISQQGGEVTLSDDSHSVDEVGRFYDKTLPLVKSRFDYVTAFERDGGAIKKVRLPWR